MGCQAKGLGDTSWSQLRQRGTTSSVCSEGIPTGQYDEESSHGFFEGVLETPVHSHMQHGEQSGRTGGLCVVARLQSPWGSQRCSGVAHRRGQSAAVGGCRHFGKDGLGECQGRVAVREQQGYMKLWLGMDWEPVWS